MWHLILMDSCIVDYWVEIPTRCSFVIEFIIPTFFWRLNMFRTAHRSSSGALNCICSLWFICPYGDRLLPRLNGHECPLNLGNGRSPYGHINQRLQIQFRAPDDERCAARNMLSLQKNVGIINSITKLHLAGISTEWYVTVYTVWCINFKFGFTH